MMTLHIGIPALDQQEAAQIHFSHMESVEREEITRYPLSRLDRWNCENNST